MQQQHASNRNRQMRILVDGSQTNLTKFLASHATSLGGLITPRSYRKPEFYIENGLPWALDNDCYQGFKKSPYLRMLEAYKGYTCQPSCLWVTAPDVVGQAQATLTLFKEWEPILHRLGYPVALVAQDGLEHLEVPWDSLEALFIGGSTAWKLSKSAAQLTTKARAYGKPVHMGRVNSQTRLIYAASIGCNTVDGTGFSRFTNQNLNWGLRIARQIQKEQQLVQAQKQKKE